MDRPTHRLLKLPGTADPRGRLTFAQEPAHIPFPVRRMFLLHHLAEGVMRGGHAHRRQHQLLTMAYGGATVKVRYGTAEEAVRLDDPAQALYVPPMLWLELNEFSNGAVCLVLTSDIYDEADYIRDAAEFHRLTTPSA